MKDKIKYIVVIFFIIIANTISVITLNVINSKSYNEKNIPKKENLTNIKGSKDVLYSNTYNSVNSRVTTLKENSIIDQGTCGSWKYRKYQNGMLDMWATGCKTQSNYSTWNNMYAHSLSFSWSGCDVKPNNANYTMSALYKVGSGFAITAGFGEYTATGMTGYTLASASGSQEVCFDLYLHGTWK